MFYIFFRDPMDSFLLEQHLRAPLRLFPDPFSPQMLPQDPEGQAAFIEKARQHLQMWGRSPYSELLLPQIYQRPNIGALNLGLWQAAGQWGPQLSAGFLAANAAAVANAAAPRTPPPVSTPSSSGSPSPDMRAKHFQRFSPYQIPQHHTSSSSSRSSPPNANSNNNNNTSINNNNNNSN